jgi:hypothetical protein
MTVERLVKEARDHGIEFIPDDEGGLTIRSATRPPDRLREQLRKHKPEILALLRDRSAGMPYIDASGNLVIPMFCPTKYRYWDGGQHVLETLTELGASKDVVRKYARL